LSPEQEGIILSWGNSKIPGANPHAHILSTTMHNAVYVHLLLMKWFHASMLWQNKCTLFYHHNVYKVTVSDFGEKLSITLSNDFQQCLKFAYQLKIF